MKSILLGLIWLLARDATGQTKARPSPAAPTRPAAAAPVPAGSEPPWSAWFEKNTMVTEKTGYVHILWNARDAASYLQGKEKKRRLAEAARQLILQRYPKGSRDSVRLDVVFVEARDEYGAPKWDSLQRVAHLEFSKSRIVGPDGAARRSSANPEERFDKFEVF
jgi:hypothetical protein